MLQDVILLEELSFMKRHRAKVAYLSCFPPLLMSPAILQGFEGFSFPPVTIGCSLCFFIFPKRLHSWSLYNVHGVVDFEICIFSKFSSLSGVIPAWELSPEENSLCVLTFKVLIYHKNIEQGTIQEPQRNLFTPFHCLPKTVTIGGILVYSSYTLHVLLVFKGTDRFSYPSYFLEVSLQLDDVCDHSHFSFGFLSLEEGYHRSFKTHFLLCLTSCQLQ